MRTLICAFLAASSGYLTQYLYGLFLGCIQRDALGWGVLSLIFLVGCFVVFLFTFFATVDSVFPQRD